MLNLFKSRDSQAARLAALDRVQAIIEFDLDGNILDANANFLGAVGYSLDEIKGRHHSIFVDETTRSSAEYRTFWSDLRGGAFNAGQFRRIAKGGREVWIEASYNPLLDSAGHPFGFVKFATDITRQKTEDAARAAEIAAIRRVQAVIAFDLDGTILEANDNFLSVMGYRLDEIVGRKHAMFVDPQTVTAPTMPPSGRLCAAASTRRRSSAASARAARPSGSRPPTIRSSMRPAGR